MIPDVLKRRTELARLTKASKINFVGSTVILASPLALWLEGAELLG